MSQGTAQNVVLGVIIVGGAVVIYDAYKKTGKPLPSFRTIVAMTLLAGALSLGAAVAPQIAGPFALLVGLAVVLSRTASNAGGKP